MNWWINTGGLIAADEDKLRKPVDYGWIPFDRFEELTGKRFNWEIRKNKFISTERKSGHIKCYDEQFIVNEHYKHGKKVYKCEHINEDGTALLTPRGNALKAITARETKDWEIT